MHRILLLIAALALNFVLIGPSTIWANSMEPKFVIVSDIDDTIKLSQMRPRGKYISLIKNILSMKGAFTATPQLYQALYDQGVKIHYVSATPDRAAFLARSFLKTSNFPPGTLWTRASLKTVAEDSKVERITQLMRDHPSSQFILIGDNGEYDVAAYERIAQSPEFRGRVAKVLIHHLYDGPPSMDILPGQTPFLTTADLAWEFHKMGLVSESQLAAVFEAVIQGLKSNRRIDQERTLPRFTEIDCEQLNRVAQRLNEMSNPYLRMAFGEILRLSRDRLFSATPCPEMLSFKFNGITAVP